MSSKIQKIDDDNQKEEASPPNEVEQSFIDAAMKYPGVRASIFTPTDRVQITRGYQTYDQRGEDTNKAFKAISDFRTTYRAHEFCRKKQPKSDDYLAHIWPEVIYPPDKYGHILISLRFTEIDIAAIENLEDDELTRLQGQRLAAYSLYKEKLSRESGVQRYKHSLLVDLKDSGMGILMGKKKAMIQRVMSIGSDFYPETVWKIFVINAPFVFRSAWTIVKRWVHPVTQAKLSVHSASVCKKVLMEQGVQEQDVPQQLGGQSKGITSLDVLNLMIAYSEELDKAASSPADAEENEGQAGPAPPNVVANRGGRRTAQTTML